ncbi:MAG: glycosyltransferase family 9 protein [Bacteriovoracia bacterium]
MKLVVKKWMDFWIGNILLFILKPVVVLLGKILRRDHSPVPQGEIAFIKLLGGGSLVIALPALLALKKKYPHNNLILITTPAIKPFAETLGIFEEFVILNDTGLKALFFSSIKALRRLWKIDTVIDYEVYSRLTTLFALFTCARNRVGFYREDVKARQFFSTHTIFFNLFYGSWYFYEEISKLLGATIPSDEDTRKHFFSYNQLQKINGSGKKIGIGHGCSDLSPERMLSKEHWLKHFQAHLMDSCEVHFLGGPKEKDFGDEIIEHVKSSFPQVAFINQSGKKKLKESIQLLSQMDEFWAIDSALLHYSRLIGIKTISYFGPTMPQSLIKPISYLDEKIHYQQIACSPCVHVTETPPCHGNNRCIQNLFLS